MHPGQVGLHPGLVEDHAPRPRSLSCPGHRLLVEALEGTDGEQGDALVVELTRDGMTMMCVTHEMGFASQVANRIIFMDEGHIVENCSKDEFFEGAKSDRAQMFLSKILNH